MGGTLCLTGDHRQLAPFPRNKKVRERTQLSLMERVSKMPGVAFTMLNIQYRMHFRIAAWPSSKFYRSKLQTAKTLCSSNLLPD